MLDLSQGSRFSQVQHSEHLSVILRGRCSTWSISVSFCVAGAALGASHPHFAWQVQKRTQSCAAKKEPSAEPSPWGHYSYALVLAQPSNPSAHLHITIYTTSSTQHHLHYIIKHNIINTHTHTIYTTSSTQHHQDDLINTSPST